RFAAACGRLLGRHRPPIHVHDQCRGWRGTLLLRGGLEMFFGERSPHAGSALAHGMVVMHPTALHRALRQMGLGCTGAIPSSWCAWHLGSIRMASRAKTRGRGRSTLPMTLRMMGPRSSDRPLGSHETPKNAQPTPREVETKG